MSRPSVKIRGMTFWNACKDAGTLMPDGLTLAMTRAELRDLVAFLAARGLQK